MHIDRDHPGALHRRRFLLYSGGIAAAGAVLAACRGGNDREGGNGAPRTGDPGEATGADVTATRTAASLELFVMSVYDRVTGRAGELEISEPVGQAAAVFHKRHEEHAKVFNRVAGELGGEPYAEANPKAAEEFAGTVDGLEGEQDALRLLYALEIIASQSHQQAAAQGLSTPLLRRTAMGVSAAEARHAAFLGMFLEPAVIEPNVAFQPLDKAVDDSFFV